MPGPATPLLVVVAGLVAAVGLTTAGCGGDDDDSGPATADLPSTRADLEAREWVLDPADSSLTVDDDNPVTLAVDGDAVSGRAPCNTFHGSFDLGDDDSVEIGPLALTRTACPGSAMEAEADFVAALEAVDHVEVDVDDENRMALTGDGDLRLAFRSYTADDLLAGTWDIVDVARGWAIAIVAVQG